MAARCPICGKPTDPAFQPFCSKRCADIDLSRWLSGVYVAPGVDGDAADVVPPSPPEGDAE